MAIGSLIKLGGNLESPGNAKASDFPAVGPSGAAGTASGSEKLIKQTVTQEGPRHTEDGGPGMPVPSDRSRVVAENFKVSQAPAAGTAVSIPGSIDLVSGQMVPNAKEQTY